MHVLIFNTPLSFSANKSDVQTQLNLALAWNRSDMARKEIFNVENRAAWQVTFSKIFVLQFTPSNKYERFVDTLYIESKKKLN